MIAIYELICVLHKSRPFSRIIYSWYLDSEPSFAFVVEQDNKTANLCRPKNTAPYAKRCIINLLKNGQGKE